jgi:hypothetical protein
MQKGPATEAVAAAERSLATVKEEASMYAAEALQSAEASLANLKDQLAKKEYEAVVTGAPAVQSEIDALRTATATGKADFDAATAEWGTLSTDLPNMVSALQSRVDTLSSARRLPRGMTKDALESAKAGLDQVKATWESATTAFNGGSPVNAVTIAKGAQAKATEVMEMLGMPAG